MVDGSIASKNQPMLGKPIDIGRVDWASTRARLGVCGHIHARQHWIDRNMWHGYTGSPYGTDFGQDELKSVLPAEFDGPELMQTVKIETSAAKLS